jgi:hypothetical protein
MGYGVREIKNEKFEENEEIDDGIYPASLRSNGVG